MQPPRLPPQRSNETGSDCRLECTAGPGRYPLWWRYNHCLRPHKSSDTAINPIEGTGCAALGFDVVDADGIIYRFKYCQIMMP